MTNKELKPIHGKALLLGTLLSSVGTFTFFLAQIAWLKKIDFSVASIALFVGSIRGATIVSMISAGFFSDRLSERKLLLVTEVMALACSGILFYLWPDVKNSYALYITIASIRSFFLALQTGSRSKILKILSGGENKKDHQFAIWMNLVTHGPIVVSALISFFLFDRVPFQWIIALDMITFLLNGLILYQIPETGTKHRHTNQSYFEFMRAFYSSCRKWAILDAGLAVCMAGLVMLMVRLSTHNPELVSLLYFAYGSAIWIAGALPLKVDRPNQLIFSILLIICAFVAIGLAVGHDLILVVIHGFVCIGYWSAYHIITSGIQQTAPTEKMAGIQSARGFQMLVILVSGEILVGAISNKVSPSHEVYFRAFLCLLLIGLVMKVFKAKKLDSPRRI